MSKPNSPKSNQPAIERLAYSPEEAALSIGLCRDTIYRLIRRGEIKAAGSKRKLIPRTELLRFINS